MARRTQLRWLVVLTLAWIAWAVWFASTGTASFAMTVVDDDGRPLPGAVVEVAGDPVATTGPDGVAVIDWNRGEKHYELSAPGYLPLTVRLDEPPDEAQVVRMRSSILRGQVTDGDGLPVPGVYVAAGLGEGVTGADGAFVVEHAQPGPVRMWRPAWEEVAFSWDGSPGARTVTVEPLVLKAVHVSGDAAGDPNRWAELVALSESTELNAVMLDLKDEDGLIFYDTAVAIAHEAGSVVPRFDLGQVARELSDKDLYLIGRIVTFQDPRAALSVPSMAVGNRETGGVYVKNGQYFLDPTDPDAREYGLSLAVEACRLGVDEIQFDYVRYPDGFGPAALFDGGASAEVRVATIQSFLETAKERLHPLGCAVAGDIFGFMTTATGDGGIGQQWEVVTDVLDVISPMVYPSHYDSGWYGFDNPNDHPGEMVTRALGDGLERLDSAAVIRPWLQDFGYTDDQVREQIDAAEQYGLGWMLWNAFSNVSEAALEPEG